MTAETALDPLIGDFVGWVAARDGGRAYRDVLEAWRTSCPRLTVWEDAAERGFVERVFRAGDGTFIEVTAAGRAFVVRNNKSRPLAAATTPIAPSPPSV